MGNSAADPAGAKAEGIDDRTRPQPSLGGSVAARNLSGDRGIASLIGLAATPGQRLGIASDAQDRLAAISNLDATLAIDNKLSLSLGYSGLFSSQTQSNAAKLTIGLTF